MEDYSEFSALKAFVDKKFENPKQKEIQDSIQALEDDFSSEKLLECFS